MFIDDTFVLSDAQAETTQAAHASTNVVDTLASGDAIAKPLWVKVNVDTTFTSAGAATLTTAIETSDDEAFGTYDTVLATGALALATLVAGYNIIMARLPLGMKRYIRAKYTIGTTTMTAGKVNAVLTTGIDKTFDVE